MDSVLYSRRGRKISLTALIDVVFILLMFFMLTSSFTRFSSVDFQAPVAVASPDVAEPQRVVLQRDGTLRLGSQVIAAPGQTPDARHLVVDRPVVLLPEATTDLQHMVTALEMLKQLHPAVTLGRALPASTPTD